MSSRHIPQASSSSFSSYGPVLIHSTPDHAAVNAPSLPIQRTTSRFLQYPYPFSVLVVADIAFILHHALQRDTQLPVLLLTGARALVSLVGVGCSSRWRSRGGWIASVNGASIGAAIWEDCANQLKGEGRLGDEGQSLFLYSVVLICALEYVLFVLLLRLSPPNHKIQPLSLRPPPASHQISTPFAFSSEDLPPSPRSIRHRRFSHAQSTHSPLAERLHITASDEDMNDSASAGSESDYEIGPEEEEEEEEEDPYNSDSTISESSIIDLPPPLQPQRIIPPSLSMRSNLTQALDSSPMLGPLIRRSRSSRFLERSWGSQASELERRMANGIGDMSDQERSYGTFEGSGPSRS